MQFSYAVLALAATVLAQQEAADGQPQVISSVAPVNQITDGQVQAATAAPVAQINDGQIQQKAGAISVPTPTPSPAAAPAVSQIGDGQIQAATAAPAVSQINDGQIQAAAPANTSVTSPSVAAFKGTGSMVTFSSGLVAAAGVAAAFALL